MSTLVKSSSFVHAMPLTPVLNMVKSDTVNIPYVGTNYKDGAATTITTNKLIDSGANFTTLNVKVGDIVWNTTSGTAAYVTNVDSATQLSLSFNAFGTLSEQYRLFAASDMFGFQSACYLYITTGGTLRVTTAGGEVLQYTAVSSTICPVQVTRVHSTNTGATGLIALW